MVTSYPYNYGYESAIGVTAGLFSSMIFLVYFCIILAWIPVAVFEIIGMWKTFKKAGKNGWEALIPFYNMWTLFEISGYHGAKIFFIFIPYAGVIIYFVYSIKAAISLAQKFKKPGGFAALLILLPVVGYCILGFNNDKYYSSLGAQL